MSTNKKRKQTINDSNKPTVKEIDNARSVTPNSPQDQLMDGILNKTDSVTEDNSHYTHQTIHFQQSDNSNSHETRSQHHKYGSNIQEHLKIFNNNVTLGPVYVCTCCLQTWL